MISYRKNLGGKENKSMEKPFAWGLILPLGFFT
jgi:hypothetical protein